LSGVRFGIGATILAAWIVVALAAPLLPLLDPDAQPDGLVLRNLAPMSVVTAIRGPDGKTAYATEVRRDADGGRSARRGDVWTRLSEGTARIEPARFVLGTDGLGRDVLSRLVWGARVSLAAGLLAALVAVAIGGGVGLVAGLAGGRVDALLMRATDAALAIPRLFLLLLLAALFRPSLGTTVVLVGSTTWMAAARLVRGETMAIRGREFVAAAHAAGASPSRVAFRHVLPAWGRTCREPRPRGWPSGTSFPTRARSWPSKRRCGWDRRCSSRRRFRFWAWGFRRRRRRGAG
jgi:ABC-type dipeptide/oligopeptide/nickel transport system permease subunit